MAKRNLDPKTALADLVEVTKAYRMHNDEIAKRLPGLEELEDRCKKTLKNILERSATVGKSPQK